MSRLADTFSQLRQQDRKALLGYVVAGDPATEATVPLMHDMVTAGVNAIELGMPFSDPEAEGPVIQLAHERALANQVSLKRCLQMVAEFRLEDPDTPVILMGYLNPIETMGHAEFARQAAAAGIDGMIIVNMPPEETGALGESLSSNGIDLVYLLAPTTTDERARMICGASRGFVYYVSLKGTTGAATIDVDDVAGKLARFGAMGTLPILVGFGIKSGETAARVAPLADGVVVGSAIVSLMDVHQGDLTAMRRAIAALLREIRQALDGT